SREARSFAVGGDGLSAAWEENASVRPMTAAVTGMDIRPDSEIKNSRMRCQAVGARRLRRFNVGVVLDGREVQAEGTVKRPEGRAPVVSHGPTSEFGIRRNGFI